MRTIRFWTVASGLVALVSMPSVAAAIEGPAELSILQVTQYIWSGQPADHVMLRDHFAALAERYTADAKRHADMAKGYVGNPNRGPSATLDTHCRRLAARASEAAATLEELAEHYGRLAEGIPSVAPVDGLRFEAGEGARQPTDRELRLAALDARTPWQHAAIEEYFLALATRRTAEANAHVARAQAYRGNPNRRGGDPAVHCDRLAKQAREAAARAKAAAFDHRQLAG